MTRWRAKDMSLGERAQFRGYFEQFYNATSCDNRLALLVINRRSEPRTMLIPEHRSEMVEKLSPGGWRNCPEASDEEWSLVVGDACAVDQMGLKHKAPTV